MKVPRTPGTWTFLIVLCTAFVLLVFLSPKFGSWLQHLLIALGALRAGIVISILIAGAASILVLAVAGARFWLLYRRAQWEAARQGKPLHRRASPKERAPLPARNESEVTPPSSP
jgi:hypothetical protein